MPTIWFYFDFVCPYAYIALHQLPQVLQGLSWQIRYCPIAYKTPPTTADITQAQQLAQTMQLPLLSPAIFPFDSTAWSHMALAANLHGQPSRYICTTLLNAIWQHGHNPNDAAIQNQAWQAATELLPHRCDRNTPHAPPLLAKNQHLAEQHNISNAPSFVLQTPNKPNPQQQVFCGLEALPQLQTAVQQHQTLSL